MIERRGHWNEWRHIGAKLPTSVEDTTGWTVDDDEAARGCAGGGGAAEGRHDPT